MNRKKAFTIIELLIVITIIAILSIIVSVSYSRAKMRSRDSIRITDMNLMKMTLKMYLDNTGVVPDNHCNTGANNEFCRYPYDPTTGLNDQTADGSGKYIFQELIEGKYIDKIPQNPRYTTQKLLDNQLGLDGVYYYWPNSPFGAKVGYLITALETESSTTGYRDSYRTSPELGIGGGHRYCTNQLNQTDYCLEIKK